MILNQSCLPKITDQSGTPRGKKARVTVLDTPDKWFGVTYREDREAVADASEAADPIRGI